MRIYNKYRKHSFKCDTHIEKEVEVVRMYMRHNKFYGDRVYAETTNVPNILIIPDSIIKNLKDNSPYGYTGEIKDGSYRINNVRVEFSNIHSVYNGEGYAEIKEITSGIDEVLMKFFNATQNKLDTEQHRGLIDNGMYEVCKHFCELGFKTVGCCNGHGKKKAYIAFSTEINAQALEDLLVNSQDFILLEHKMHEGGNFEYLRIQFEFNKDNINKILRIGGR